MSDIGIKIKIDTGKSCENVEKVTKSLDNLGLVSEKTRRNIDLFAHSTQAISGIVNISNYLSKLANAGIEANRSFENLKIQLTGLISANSSNISSLNRALSASEKWNIGLKQSESILKTLNETNAKTKFSLEEIAGAFNMFYATSANQGSINKATLAMDSIALAAQAVGKNLSDLTPMMDSLATGTVVAGSEMGSFMKIVGLTNEELKKANQNGAIYDYLIEKLAKFKEMSGEALGFDTALSGVKQSF